MTEHQSAMYPAQPTVIMRIDRSQDRYAVVTASDALVVFRSPEEARKYQEHTGNTPPEEGFEPVGVNAEELECLLDVQGIRLVAVPEPWTGYGGVDVFEAGDFIAMLQEHGV